METAVKLLTLLFNNNESCEKLTAYEPKRLLVQLLGIDIAHIIIEMLGPILKLMDLKEPTPSIEYLIKSIKCSSLSKKDLHAWIKKRHYSVEITNSTEPLNRTHVSETNGTTKNSKTLGKRQNKAHAKNKAKKPRTSKLSEKKRERDDEDTDTSEEEDADDEDMEKSEEEEKEHNGNREQDEEDIVSAMEKQNSESEKQNNKDNETGQVKQQSINIDKGEEPGIKQSSTITVGLQMDKEEIQNINTHKETEPVEQEQKGKEYMKDQITDFEVLKPIENTTGGSIQKEETQENPWISLHEANRPSTTDKDMNQYVDMYIAMLPYISKEIPTTQEFSIHLVQGLTASHPVQANTPDKKKKNEKKKRRISTEDLTRLLAHDALVPLDKQYEFMIEKDLFSIDKFKVIDKFETVLQECSLMLKKSNTVSIIQAFRLGGIVHYIKTNWYEINTNLQQYNDWEEYVLEKTGFKKTKIAAIRSIYRTLKEYSKLINCRNMTLTKWNKYSKSIRIYLSSDAIEGEFWRAPPIFT
jgi:hypothetical protein